jgi:hypothetical protein
MNIPIFLSYPKPHLKIQDKFIEDLTSYLDSRGLVPRTLGVTDYDMNEPLTAIRRLMLESNGLITIAFRRIRVDSGVSRPDCDNDSGMKPERLSKIWFTSPYIHIEPAMAFQIGLPILIMREKGVIQEGILDRGVTGTYIDEFDLKKPVKENFQTEKWKQIVGKWEGYVRQVVEKKGRPPRLY